MIGATLKFEFVTPTDEDRFIREYLVDAWDRFLESDFWTNGWFWRYSQFAEYESGPDGGLVRIVFDGDPDALVETESEYWADFDGLQSWDLQRYDELGYQSLLEQQQDTRGELGGRWEYRMKSLLSQFALEYHREFSTPLPVVGEKTQENPLQVGFWSAFHNLMVQCGYDWYDETELCQKAMENRLKWIANYRGTQAALKEYVHILSEWQAYEQELEEWFEENPTGEASEP
ncbi:hypothetical protein EGH21_15155 [Halomicroarcula sp. F13]|uniref:Uncharacterized protein n=1 Tax=Haloarcula rubra TaxID=2487747 RepID=A0AAW4PVV3_9EURY|nr:hypothetical protein [Halomicroarcula rubra]MBX0324367.1 hypothetical protein [Halomicroarcula rubra]